MSKPNSLLTKTPSSQLFGKPVFGGGRLKILIGVLMFIFCILEGVVVVSAAGDTVFDGGGIDRGLRDLFPETVGTGLIRSDDIILVTLGWVRFALTLLGTVAFVAFLWAGALYITAFLSSDNAEQAKKVMIWTATGIIIILMAYAIVATLIRAST